MTVFGAEAPRNRLIGFHWRQPPRLSRRCSLSNELQPNIFLHQIKMPPRLESFFHDDGDIKRWLRPTKRVRHEISFVLYCQLLVPELVTEILSQI